jgi:queuine/archaeosine tRNA-ribosyltransferase
LRTESAKQLMDRDVAGFAIGGLRYIKLILLII